MGGYARARRPATVLIIGIVTMCAGSLLPASPAAAVLPGRELNALRGADFLVDIQNQWGAIPDYPGGGTANYDSHMEYALWGLAAAFEETHDPKYLAAMKAGLSWLADRQRSDGSWWLGYASVYPFAPIDSAYGVSATIGLFIHDLWWYDRISHDHEFTALLLPNVELGLSFLYGRMRAPDGTFRSAYIRADGGGYARNDYRYASDQVDMYLGLRAASKLLGRTSYWEDAMNLRTILRGSRFFLSSYRRYALGIFPSGTRDTYMSLLTVWPQGYIPWVIGSNSNTRASTGWLDARQRLPEGSVVFRDGAHRYALASEVLLGAHIGLKTGTGERATAAGDWLTVLQDDATGGMTVSPVNFDRHSNLTAFAVLGWYGMRPRLPR
jgi:prenyltransferase/squalene oxidase-like repeat protein